MKQLIKNIGDIISNAGKLGIYVRQSKTKEDSVSIPDQIEQGKKKAQELGMQYVLYNEGSGESAAYDDLDNRPEMRKLLVDVKDGIISCVWTVDLSRISRNEDTRNDIKKVFKQCKCVVYYGSSNKMDYNNSTDDFIGKILGAVYENQIAEMKTKIKSALLYNVTVGKVGGGLFKSFGYKKGEHKQLVIDEEEMPIVKEIYQLYLSGLGTEAIANQLNEKGIPTKSSKVLKEGLHIKDKYSGKIKLIAKDKMLWSGPVILEIIKNPIYKGQRRYKGNLYSAPSLIDSYTWDAAQEQIAKNRNKGGKMIYKYLLNDLLFCGCGCGFRGRTRPTKRDHIYYCASKNNANGSCGIRSINIDYLNNIIWNMVTNSSTIAHLAIEEVNKLKNPHRIKELEIEKLRLENAVISENKGKNRILDLVRKGRIEESEADSHLKEIKDTINKHNLSIISIQSQLDNQKNTIEVINDVETFQNQLKNIKGITDYEAQHRIVRLFIEKVVINFDNNSQIFTLDVLVKLTGNRTAKNIFELDKKALPNEFDLQTLSGDIVWKPKYKHMDVPLSSMASGMWPW